MCPSAHTIGISKRKSLHLGKGFQGQQTNYFWVRHPLFDLTRHVGEMMALKAMWDRKNAQLTVSTRQDDRNVFIDIKDTGAGIPPEKLNAIFDPFFTTKPPRGEEKEGEPTGTGLGLHICLELLKPYKGDIRVKSQVGKGSTFTIVLPK